MNEFTQHGLFHRLLLRMGWQFVNNQQQLPVYRDGEVNHVLGPGYHRPINTWRESYGTFVSTAIRMVHLERISVQTKDCISVLVEVDVTYSFDATECVPSQIMSSMVCLSQRRMNNVVEKYVQQAMQDVGGEFSEAELANGLNRPCISRKVRTRLQMMVGTLGLVFRGNTAVAITRITPPALINEARQLAHRNQIYAASVNQLSHEIARDLNSQEIARHSSSVQFAYVEHRNQNDQHNAYPIYNNRTKAYSPNKYHDEEVIA